MDAHPPLEDIAAFLDGTTLSPEERAHITEHLARCESCYEIFAGAVDFQEEDIAAFLDGTTLSPEERARISEHLARSESYYEIFARAAHFQEEDKFSAEDTGGRGVLPFPLAKEQDERRREESKENPAYRRSSQWLPLAASVVLVAGLGFFTWQLLAPPKITLAGMVEPIEEKTGISDVLYDKEVFRSGDEPADLGWDHAAFLVGVHLIDLRLSVNDGNVEAAEGHLQGMGNAFNAMSGFGDLGKRCSNEYVTLKDAETLEPFARELPSLEKEIEQSLTDDFSFSFGLWAEAGRLAAVTRTQEFFDRRTNRRFLSSLLKNPPGGGDESLDTVPDDLQAIEDIWSRGDFSEDYTTLAEHFRKIIKAYESSPSELHDLPLPGE